MDSIGIIFGLIIAIIVIVSWIKNLDPQERSGLQDKLNRSLAQILGEQNSSSDLSEVKIYDENGNVINFQNDTVADNNEQDIVIYDEDGNVVSALVPPPFNKNDSIPESTTLQEAANAVEEVESHADMYRDFIRSNGGSSIIIQEILGKPAALRDN